MLEIAILAAVAAGGWYYLNGREAADVNGDHKVNSTDGLGVAQHTPTGTLAPSPVYYNPGTGVRRVELAVYDVNKDGNINSTDGLLVASSEGQPFLALNGIQTQSAGVQALIGHGAALRAAGVRRVRLSPCANGFAQVLALFNAVYNADMPAAQAREQRLDFVPLDRIADFLAGSKALPAECDRVSQTGH